MAWTPPDLKGKVALVAGASRGAGRGVAVALGGCGAAVVVTGRSGGGVKTGPGTLEETAAMVREAGGTADPVGCDHRDDAAVERLAGHIGGKHGRLDVLVNAVWGGHDALAPGFLFDGVPWQAPFWEHPPKRWAESMGSVEAYWRTARAVAPLLGNGSLVVHVTDGVGDDYRGNLFWDLSHDAINRMVVGMAADFKPRGVACVGLSPGFMRTERVLEFHGSTEATWRSNPELARTETPQYSGRAVACIAADPKRMEWTGRLAWSGPGHPAGHPIWPEPGFGLDFGAASSCRCAFLLSPMLW